MSLYVERDITVNGQTMHAVITRANHVSVSGKMTVRGIVYNISAHFTCRKGTWAFHDETPDDRAMSIKGAYQGNEKRNWDKRPAPTVRDFIVSSMVTVLLDFVQDNGQLFKEAEIGRLDHEIEGADAKIAKLELELHQAKTKRLELLNERYPGPLPANPFSNGTIEHELYESARERFITEQMSGFLDERGVMHAPTSRNAAEILWRGKHEKAKLTITEAGPEIAQKRQARGKLTSHELTQLILQEA